MVNICAIRWSGHAEPGRRTSGSPAGSRSVYTARSAFRSRVRALQPLRAEQLRVLIEGVGTDRFDVDCVSGADGSGAVARA
jgi:hypothetical protein